MHGFLALPSAACAEVDVVRRRAKRLVEWVVSPAEPEAARHLAIERQCVRRFVTGNETRGQAIGFCRTRLRQVAHEEPVEELGPILVEIVPANATREVELRCDTERRFAKDGRMLKAVMEIREEQVVLCRQRAGGESVGARGVREDRWAIDGRGECVEPSDVNELTV